MLQVNANVDHKNVYYGIFMEYYRPMNFSTVISELEESGMKQRQMAAHCLCQVNTISALKCGRNKAPRWPVGNGLLELHKERCPKSELLQQTG